MVKKIIYITWFLMIIGGLSLNNHKTNIKKLCTKSVNN